MNQYFVYFFFFIELWPKQKPAEKAEDLIRMRKVSHFLLSHSYATISPVLMTVC